MKITESLSLSRRMLPAQRMVEGKAKDRDTLRAHVAQTLPLNQTAEAHRLLEEHEIVGAVTLNPKA